MSKALVIKGADFTANRVAQIVITQVVPCTGLSLSQNTITFNTLGATTQLTATKTPVDTTEQLSWSSSNENVATVVNGLVTCVGLGTATITATCGTQSATCTVTCSSIVINLKAGHYDTGKGLNSQSSGKTYVSFKTLNNGALFYSDVDVLGGYKAFYGNDSTEGMFCIPIPSGATHYTISCSDSTNFYMMSYIYNTNTQASDRPSSSANWSAAALAAKNGRGSATLDFSSHPTANGFVASLANTTDTSSPINLTGIDFTITFS